MQEIGQTHLNLELCYELSAHFSLSIQNINVSKRFLNMPINSYITIVGQVKRRPNNLKNFVSKSTRIERF